MLLHGLGDSADLWRHQVADLAAGHRTITLDLRGHGQSPRAGSEFTVMHMADDVHGTLEALAIGAVVLIGLSMGGGVAQAFTIRHPELVRALVLVSTSSEFPEATRRRFFERAARAERQGMAAVIEETVPRWFTPAFSEMHPDEVERTRRGVLEVDPAAFAAASRANAIRHFTDDLPSVRCPVLFIGGAEDPADPRRAIEIYRHGLRNFRAELIPGASHLVPVEASTAFNAIVLRFLAEVEREPELPGGAP
ncbi:MAG: alpha/beta fold hydrolase [Candidatus Limnocylindria bacterium]